MCGSTIDSVTAGTIICGVGAFFILSGKAEYIWLGSAVFIIGTMQFIDALIWILKAQNISTKFVSKYGVILILMLELIIAYLGYVFYYKKRIELYEIALLLFIIVSGNEWISLCKDTIVTNDGYLKWCNINIPSSFKVLFITFLLIPMLFFPILEHRLLALGMIVGTWLYNYNHEAFGSRWCYGTVLYAIMALGLFLYKSS